LRAGWSGADEETVSRQESVMKTAIAAEKSPRSFRAALKAGWAVVSDKSNQPRNEKRREGRLTMQKRGCAGLLEVDYVGTLTGFRFSVPRIAN
jgi:hypothetical protein